MKVIRICSMIQRLAFLLVLILGISFWANWIVPTQSMRGIHMLLGIIVVLALWGIGFAHSFLLKKGSIALGIAAFILGLVVVIVGMQQDTWRADINVELMNTIHLLLGICAIGLGEMIAGRSKRLATANA